MKKVFIISLILVVFISLGIVVDVSNTTDVLIYSTSEDYRNAKLMEMLKEEFPEYNIEIQYMSTSKGASKIQAEGSRSKVDIILDMEYAYASMIEDHFATLDFMDSSIYLDNLIISDKFLPNLVYSVGIVINKDRMESLGLPVPTSYIDLLNPIYKGEIVIPNPKATATGYSFVKALLNYYGENDGWDYFDKLDKNVKMYTSSGSGTINSIIIGETSIAIGSIGVAVNKINEGQSNLEVILTDEGCGYNVTANAIVAGKEKNPVVKKVFEFIQNKYMVYDKQYYYPEKIYKDDLEIFIKDYPVIKSMDMTGFDDLEEKERILNLWKY